MAEEKQKYGVWLLKGDEWLHFDVTGLRPYSTVSWGFRNFGAKEALVVMGTAPAKHYVGDKENHKLVLDFFGMKAGDWPPFSLALFKASRSRYMGNQVYVKPMKASLVASLSDQGLTSQGCKPGKESEGS